MTKINTTVTKTAKRYLYKTKMNKKMQHEADYKAVVSYIKLMV